MQYNTPKIISTLSQNKEKKVKAYKIIVVEVGKSFVTSLLGQDNSGKWQV